MPSIVDSEVSDDSSFELTVFKHFQMRAGMIAPHGAPHQQKISTIASNKMTHCGIWCLAGGTIENKRDGNQMEIFEVLT